MKHLIVGNGVAGTSAAQSIRRFDETAEITVITEESLPFYSRLRLPELVAGTLEEKKLIIHQDTWYEENRFNLITNKKVASIDPGPKQIVLDGGTHIAYDKLLIATGGRAALLPLKGIGKNGVFTLRDIADARRIRAYAENVGLAIIIGGGVLGLEIANALRKLGKKVTVIEFFDRLLPRQLDPEGSSVLMDRLTTLGMNFFMGARTEEVLGSAVIEGVRLRDDSMISGQMVVISAGMEPEISLFKNLQIQLGIGVPVNDNLETALADIYAAGDVAEHRQKIYGVWPAAEKQGEVAGLNMAGGSATYGGSTMSHFLNVAGIDLFSAGEIDAESKLTSFSYKDSDNGIYRKIVVKDDTVAGCIFCGDTTGRKETINAMETKLPVKNLMAIMEKLDMKLAKAPVTAGHGPSN